MDLNQILDCIGRWNDLRAAKDAEAINSYFKEGNSFLFETNNFVTGKDIFMHVYPGITISGELKFFLISSQDDNEDQCIAAESSASYITVCDLTESHNVGGEITPKDAIGRIENWEKHHTEWINQQVSTPENIFQAFAIPSSDIIDGDDLRIYMGLKPAESGFNADLVIFDKAGDILTINSKFFDMVRPVPPFNSEGSLKESNFYLLNAK